MQFLVSIYCFQKCFKKEKVSESIQCKSSIVKIMFPSKSSNFSIISRHMLLIELSTFILKSERGLIPIVLSIVVLIKFPVNFSIDDVLSTNLFVFNKSLKASKKGSNETVSSVCISSQSP